MATSNTQPDATKMKASMNSATAVADGGAAVGNALGNPSAAPAKTQTPDQYQKQDSAMPFSNDGDANAGEMHNMAEQNDGSEESQSMDVDNDAMEVLEETMRDQSPLAQKALIDVLTNMNARLEALKTDNERLTSENAEISAHKQQAERLAAERAQHAHEKDVFNFQQALGSSPYYAEAVESIGFSDEDFERLKLSDIGTEEGIQNARSSLSRLMLMTQHILSCNNSVIEDLTRTGQSEHNNSELRATLNQTFSNLGRRSAEERRSARIVPPAYAAESTMQTPGSTTPNYARLNASYKRAPGNLRPSMNSRLVGTKRAAATVYQENSASATSGASHAAKRQVDETNQVRAVDRHSLSSLMAATQPGFEKWA